MTLEHERDDARQLVITRCSGTLVPADLVDYRNYWSRPSLRQYGSIFIIASGTDVSAIGYSAIMNHANELRAHDDHVVGRIRNAVVIPSGFDPELLELFMELRRSGSDRLPQLLRVFNDYEDARTWVLGKDADDSDIHAE